MLDCIALRKSLVLVLASSQNLLLIDQSIGFIPWLRLSGAREVPDFQSASLTRSPWLLNLFLSNSYIGCGHVNGTLSCKIGFC